MREYEQGGNSENHDNDISSPRSCTAPSVVISSSENREPMPFDIPDVNDTSSHTQNNSETPQQIVDGSFVFVGAKTDPDKSGNGDCDTDWQAGSESEPDSDSESSADETCSVDENDLANAPNTTIDPKHDDARWDDEAYYTMVGDIESVVERYISRKPCLYRSKSKSE